MTRTLDTQLESYQKIQPKLNTRQQQVHALVKQATMVGMDMTNTEIANALHWKINCVTGRVNELRKQGKLCESQKRWNSETQRFNWAWKTC